MYCLTVSYIQSELKKFDLEYYKNNHLSLVREKFSPYGLKGVYLKEAVGSKPLSADTFFASVDLVFEDMDRMKQALANEGASINRDIANYTDAEVVYDFSDYQSLS